MSLRKKRYLAILFVCVFTSALVSPSVVHRQGRANASAVALTAVEMGILLSAMSIYWAAVCASEDHQEAWARAAAYVVEKNRSLLKALRERIQGQETSPHALESFCATPNKEAASQSVNMEIDLLRSWVYQIEADARIQKFALELDFLLSHFGFHLRDWQKAPNVEILENQLTELSENENFVLHFEKILSDFSDAMQFSKSSGEEHVHSASFSRFLECMKDPNTFMLLFGAAGYATTILGMGYYLVDRITKAATTRTNAQPFLESFWVAFVIAFMDTVHHRRSGYHVWEEPEALFRNFSLCMSQNEDEFMIQDSVRRRALTGAVYAMPGFYLLGQISRDVKNKISAFQSAND